MPTRTPPDPFVAATGRKAAVIPAKVKHAAKAKRDNKASVENARAKYRDTSAIPVAELPDVIDPDKPLTDKAKLFVKFWAQGESISSAAARAGYADGATYAYRLVHYPQVQALYAEEKRLYEEASQMTRKRVMDGLLEGIEMAKIMAEPASVINGWKTIGQMCGYFEPVKKKLEITVKGQIAMQKMELLSDEQLLEMLERDLVPAITNEASDELED